MTIRAMKIGLTGIDGILAPFSLLIFNYPESKTVHSLSPCYSLSPRLGYTPFITYAQLVAHRRVRRKLRS
ncbi:MAG: hypothetical protein ACJARL_002525 [Halopseudomonas sp.]|jgi:hypothetical protein